MISVAMVGALVALAIWAVQARAESAPLTAPELFAAKCAQCHEQGGWGTRALAKRMPPEQAELLRRKAIPAAYVKYVARHGIGSMPQFTRTDITDPELDRLADWLENRK